MEATLMGIPAFAISLVAQGPGTYYDTAAEFAARLALQIHEKGLPTDTFLNVNVPDLPCDSMLTSRITSQGRRRYEGTIVGKLDPRGQKYYWIGSTELSFLDLEGTDFHAVSRGHVSVTPLHLDLTNYTSFQVLSDWGLE
jgi:5'-nucleotidase